MTNDEIRAAIAKSLFPDDQVMWSWDRWVSRRKYGNTQQDYSLPDYCNDLNAISQAVATLTDEEYDRYFTDLIKLLSLVDWPHNISCIRGAQEATALQRCIAYLKAKSLFVEDEK